MLEPTKKRHTNNQVVNLRFRGPAVKKDEAVKALRDLGFVEESQSVPWHEVLNIPDSERPGRFLAATRYREGLTQVELSKLTGIPQRHISEIENSKRGIGKQNAKLFGKILKVDYRIFL